MFDLVNHQFRNGYYETMQRQTALAKKNGNVYELVRPFEKEELDFLSERMSYMEALLVVGNHKIARSKRRRRRRNKK